MTTSQKRTTLLVKNRRTVKLTLARGHVWMSKEGGGVGYPVHDSAEEVKVFEKLLRQLHKEGFKVTEDTGLVTRAKPTPKKPAELSAAEWKWRQNADEILKMWSNADYDNFKDAILDARGLLAEPPAKRAKHAQRAKRLETMLERATARLATMAKKDPNIAKYAKALLAPAKRAPSKAR